METEQTQLRQKVLPLIAILVLVLLTVLVYTEHRVELKHLKDHHIEHSQDLYRRLRSALNQSPALLYQRTGVPNCEALEMKFDSIVDDFADIINIETMAVVDKSLLDRADWQRSRRALGLSDDWDRHSRVAAVYQTLNTMPAGFDSFLRTRCLLPEPCHQTPVFKSPDKTYLVSGFPLLDPDGLTLGWVFVLEDVTQPLALISGTALFFGFAALFIGGCIYGFFYVYLGRIEQRLESTDRAQRIEIINRRFAEAQLNEAKERAEAASETKSRFMANMTHELRTPMNAIIGFSELLKDEALTEEQLDYVETIRTSSEHLLHLINDVLDISKIEAGRLEITPERCSPTELAAQVDALLRPGAEARGLDFRVILDLELPGEMMTDAKHLYQTLINLVGNAIKFTERGHVCLRADVLKDDGAISHVRFQVEDSGIGIADNKQIQIFELFRQADAGTSRKYGGTGLGLSISRQLIELMGGTLTVRSEEGSGSTFTILLPYECPVESAENTQSMS
ncbi:MAG: ATP-binding protein [Planctomycetota bacterium]